MTARRSARFPWLRLGVVTLFAVAMAYVEAAVVVYLRDLFHLTGDLGTSIPAGAPVWFRMPFFTLLRPDAVLSVLPRSSLASTEVAREVATIVMLACVGWLAGRRFRGRAAYFFYAFGVWDVGYYVFLYVLLRWPSSPRSLDVLFLIPGPWIAPVSLPILVSVGFIAGSVLVLRRSE